MAWIVNDVSKALELASYNVDAIITDRPGVLARNLKTSGYELRDTIGGWER